MASNFENSALHWFEKAYEVHMAGSPDQDYWTDLAGNDERIEAVRFAERRTITGIKPLDGQLGVFPPLSVPEALRDVMFDATTTCEDGAVRPHNTFAVLDAAKVLLLPDLLESSGLEFACLFQGQSAEELRDVAPWLVRLEEGNSITRALFTEGTGPNQLWDRAPGIFLRSGSDLDVLRSHLRRFTRVRNESGRWLYFRFWDSAAMRSLMLHQHRAGGILKQLLMADHALSILAPDPPKRALHTMRGQEKGAQTFVARTPLLTDHDVKAMAIGKRSDQVELLVAKLRRARPDEMAECPVDDQHAQVEQLVAHFEKLGFRQMRSLLLLCGWALRLGVDMSAIDYDRKISTVLADRAPEHDRIEALTALVTDRQPRLQEERRA